MTTPIWLLLDPQTNRVSIQVNEPSESSFPPGIRGAGWSARQAEIDNGVYADLLAGRIPPGEMDRIHRELWTENGETPS